MKVQATKVGFDGIKTREIGEVFEFKGELGSWMKEVDAKPADTKKPEADKQKPADTKK
tara:strand:+ start:446775 stop:446948 length:174 start_codon:yes stop_codon:yes gene_type:complete